MPEWVAWLIVSIPFVLVAWVWLAVWWRRRQQRKRLAQSLSFADVKCYTQGLINRDVQ